MATPRSGTKGKRMLPNIPQKGNGVKRGVTFNYETIETSIGGTQTPGRIKSDPLSPMNRLSNDEASLRSETSVSLDESGRDLSSNRSDEDLAPFSVHSLVDTSKSNTNVSVEIAVVSCESDKENCPNGVHLDRTPMKGNHCMIANGFDAIDSKQFVTPSPIMKTRQRTPLRRHTLDEKLLGTPECYAVVQIDKKRYNFGNGDSRNGDNEDSCSVTVAVRVRPFSQRYIIIYYCVFESAMHKHFNLSVYLISMLIF